MSAVALYRTQAPGVTILGGPIPEEVAQQKIALLFRRARWAAAIRSYLEDAKAGDVESLRIAHELLPLVPENVRKAARGQCTLPKRPRFTEAEKEALVGAAIRSGVAVRSPDIAAALGGMLSDRSIRNTVEYRKARVKPRSPRVEERPLADLTTDDDPTQPLADAEEWRDYLKDREGLSRDARYAKMSEQEWLDKLNECDVTVRLRVIAECHIQRGKRAEDDRPAHVERRRTV